MTPKEKRDLPWIVVAAIAAIVAAIIFEAFYYFH